MLQETFDSIDNYLNKLSQYWRFSAFELCGYPDFGDAGQLALLLDSITEQQLQEYQEDSDLIYARLLPLIPELLASDNGLLTVQNRQQTIIAEAPFWLKNGIKGRKWQQIEYFSQYIKGETPVLEWCAGKGHLGRLIHFNTQAEITSVEWNPDLCEQGAQLAKQFDVVQSFQQANVLTGQADHLLSQNQHAVALHACGDLHLRLLQQAIDKKTSKITFSPCCYHLIAEDVYQPVSSWVKENSHLLRHQALPKQMLKFAVAKQVTSGARQKRLNDQEVWWRLSFDSMQKELLNSSCYMPVPSFPKALLSEDFKQFCEWVIAKKQLSIAVPEQLSHYLHLGKQRLKQLRRLELLSQFFQRPLELWLVLDRALSLQEAGYSVELSEFCDSATTPRNLIIQGYR